MKGSPLFQEAICLSGACAARFSHNFVLPLLPACAEGEPCLETIIMPGFVSEASAAAACAACPGAGCLSILVFLTADNQLIHKIINYRKILLFLCMNKRFVDIFRDYDRNK